MSTPEKTVDMQLINVAKQGDMHYMADFPYGMALLAGYLREQGYNVLMLQYPIWKKKDYEQKILDNPALLYGFQVNMENIPDIIKLVTLIKESNPEAKVIFGGPFVVTSYKELLKINCDIDAVVLGEGEYTTTELLMYLKKGQKDWKNIQGIALLDEHGDIVINHYRPAIKNMDEMPFAVRDGVKEGVYDCGGKYMHDVRITTSRGCTSNCTFCAVNINTKWQKAKRWRGRSPENVVDEIQYLVEKHNVKMVNLQDSSFDDPGVKGVERTRIFCEEILHRKLEISMKAYLRANNIKDDPESIDLYKLYKKAGIDVVIIGAEAGSDYELKLYGKSASLEDNYRSFQVLNDLNLFFIHSGFIMFGPYSTLSTLRQNTQFLWKNQLYYWYPNFTTSLIVFPGTVVYDQLKKKNRIIPKKNFWESPDYEFKSPDILKLGKHYQYIRTIFKHIDEGSPLVLNAANLISRLKNKMNEKIATVYNKEIDEFISIFYKEKRILNELAHQDVIENINRVEKDGLKADLMKSSEKSYGKSWSDSIYKINSAYNNIITTFKREEVGLGGVVFNAELTSFELRHKRLNERR